MDSDLNIQDDHWELSLDIDDSDLQLTPNPDRIILGPAGIVQATNLNNENDQWELNLDIDDLDLRLTPKVVEDVGDDEDFKSGSWVSATDYVNSNGSIKNNWLHSFRNLAIPAGLICYLQSILIKCTSLEEHLLQSSIGAFLGKLQDLIDLWNHDLKSCGKGKRFTKVIISHFISKDMTISMRNMINLHTIRDDSLLDIKDSQAYKTYHYFATGKVPPRKARRYKKVASPSRKLPSVIEAEPVKKDKRFKRPAKKSTTAPTSSVAIRDTPGVSVSKKKAPTKDDRSKYIKILSDVALSEATQLKEATKRSKKYYHISQESGSDNGTDFESGVLNEQQCDSKDENDDEGDNDDDDDDDSKGDDDKADSDDDGNSDTDELSQLKQADHSAQLLEYVKSQLPTMVDDLLSTRIGYDTRTALKSYTKDFEKKPQEERKVYIDVVEKSVKDIIKDEVKSLLPQILPKKVSDFATPVIQSTITKSLENVVLAKSSSQTQSTYEATSSLIEFELKKIMIDKLGKSKSYRAPEDHRNLYDALIKSYQLDKYLFDSYGKAYSLKRSHKDKEKDEDPPAGLDQGLKKMKTSKDDEPPKGSKSKESKTSSSKGIKSQPKSSGKSMQAEEPVSNIAKARKSPCTFDELMSTPIDFSAYVIHNLKIDNLTQEILVGPAFNLLKGTCKSFVELEYHFEECYKDAIGQLDWNNPEGHEYPFDLSKPLPLIEAQGRQVVPVDYFFNNDLEYLKGRSSSRKYTTSTTKTKVAKYDNIEGIKEMVLELWSTVKVAYDKFAMWGISHQVTHVKVMKWYGYGNLEKIIVRREDQTLHKFKEGEFPRLNLRDIKDLLLLLVQTKLSNLKEDVIFDLNVALRMFTRRIVILKKVEDLQLGVESYQKKLNITKPEIFRSDISKLTPYTAYKKPSREDEVTWTEKVIHHDQCDRSAAV
nr:hypothetical protein [Tanacetum cinerariifolium]